MSNQDLNHFQKVPFVDSQTMFLSIFAPGGRLSCDFYNLYAKPKTNDKHEQKQLNSKSEEYNVSLRKSKVPNMYFLRAPARQQLFRGKIYLGPKQQFHSFVGKTEPTNRGGAF